MRLKNMYFEVFMHYVRSHMKKNGSFFELVFLSVTKRVGNCHPKILEIKCEMPIY